MSVTDCKCIISNNFLLRKEAPRAILSACVVRRSVRLFCAEKRKKYLRRRQYFLKLACASHWRPRTFIGQAGSGDGGAHLSESEWRVVQYVFGSYVSYKNVRHRERQRDRELTWWAG